MIPVFKDKIYSLSDRSVRYTQLYRIFLAAILIQMFFAAVCSRAQTDGDTPDAAAGFPNTRKFFLKNYYPIDYAGQNQMYEIVQDDRGIMYLGNNVTGILEYDGVSWRTVTLSNNNTAFSLAKDESGTIFVGGSGEIGYLVIQNGVTKYRSLMNHIPAEYKEFGPSQIRCTSQGVYFKIGNVILRWHERKMSVISTLR